MVSSSDRKDVRRLEKLAANHEAQDRETVNQICATEAGRRWYWERLSEGHIFSTTFSVEGQVMAFNEGNRNAGLRLLAQLQAYCPEQFTQMMQEANARDRRQSEPERGSNAGESGDSARATGSGSDPYADYPEPA